jgi:alginate O-acetyltransferase complex protein AlgI
MLFNSLQFILFFLAFFLILFSIPAGTRKIWLLIASCYFYIVFKPVYLLILISVILIDFFTGIQIENSKRRKKTWLVISLVSNLGILVFFKYFNFINENISFICDYLSVENDIPFVKIILPIGLSFHTFQAMSYTIEVYRGKQRAEKNILHYGLYVLYFPQLVAGPIERPQHLLPQFKLPIRFNYSNTVSGLYRISCGFFKKVVIADRLALFVDPVYSDLYASNGLSVFLATLFFTFEIYCDFSGYTDIAIGTSQIMGIKLMENFKNPYTSTSMKEFWTRWHISLSSWFRDYVYIPLGGNQKTVFRWVFNLLVVFFLSGLWHGARWNYVIWGILHGSLLIIENLVLKKIKFAVPSIIKGILVFSCVYIAWIFFRVREVNDGFIAIDQLLHLSVYDPLPAVFNTGELIFSFLLIALLLIGETFIKTSFSRNQAFVIGATLVLFFLSYLFGEFNCKEFIYFQF